MLQSEHVKRKMNVMMLFITIFGNTSFYSDLVISSNTPPFGITQILQSTRSCLTSAHGLKNASHKFNKSFIIIIWPHVPIWSRSTALGVNVFWNPYKSYHLLKIDIRTTNLDLSPLISELINISSSKKLLFKI